MEQRVGTLVYVLHTAPRADQYEFHRRDEGIAQAVALAKRRRRRAWLTDDGSEFVLLEDCREIETAHRKGGAVMGRKKTDDREQGPRDEPPLPGTAATANELPQRAYAHFVARGYEHGHDLEDWLAAERELGPATMIGVRHAID